MALKRKHLRLEDKINILHEYQNSKTSQRLLAEKYGIGKTQVCNILKDRAIIFKEWQENKFGNSKRKFKSGNQDIDSFVYDWYCTAKNNDISVTGRLLQEKALEVARLLRKDNEFKASNGWLHKFKVRHNITPKSSGESNKDREENSQTWEDFPEKPEVKVEIVESGDNIILNEHSGDYFTPSEDPLTILNDNDPARCTEGNENSESEFTEDREDDCPPKMSESNTSLYAKRNYENHDIIAVTQFHSEDFISTSSINGPERSFHNEHSTEEESRSSSETHEGDDFPKTYIEAASLISKLEKFARHVEHTSSLLMLGKIKEDYEKQHWLQKSECHS